MQTLLLNVYGAVRKSGFLETKFGRSLFSAAYFSYKRHLEDPYQALIDRHPEMFKKGHILDIGANIGYCSVVFARALDPSFSVHSFEPEPNNFSLLQQSIAKHNVADRVFPVHAAVGSKDGSLELWLNQNHHADHRIVTDEFRRTHAGAETVTVPVIQIDNYVESRGIHPIAFIKVDVQGYESEVCAGMERTLAANPNCVLSLEYMPEAMSALGFQPEALLQWCERQKLRPFALHRDGTFSAEMREVMDRGYGDLLLSRSDLSSTPAFKGAST